MWKLREFFGQWPPLPSLSKTPGGIVSDYEDAILLMVCPRSHDGSEILNIDLRVLLPGEPGGLIVTATLKKEYYDMRESLARFLESHEGNTLGRIGDTVLFS